VVEPRRSLRHTVRRLMSVAIRQEVFGFRLISVELQD
jgi:hypothetical protein